MGETSRVGPARAVWRFALRQIAALKAAHIANCREAAHELILHTPPMRIDTQSDIEIHSLTCERDYADLLWCLKTFRHYAGRSFDLVIHDDGSLTDNALENLSQHLCGVTIVSKSDADERIKPTLITRPASLTFRERLPLARRLFDFPVFAKRTHYLVLDSDVLYFSQPTEMLNLMDQRRPFFMSDYQDGYVYSRKDIASQYGVNVVPAFNTGVSYFSKEMSQPALVEEYCRDAEQKGLLSHPWTEQTLFAILFSQHTADAQRLSTHYRISHTPIDSETVCHHFVNDGSRGSFYTKGIRWLQRTRFLDDYTHNVT